MSTREKIIDDVARAAGETVGLVSGLAAQAKNTIRSKIDDMAQSMDLVPREDFERLEAVLQSTRAEQEHLKQRLAAIEAVLEMKAKSS